jgi:hypothetical protein
MTIPAPMSVVSVRRSPRSRAPSATATIGFTYWCVTTCEIDMWRRSQAYAVNAISEPTVAR